MAASKGKSKYAGLEALRRDLEREVREKQKVLKSVSMTIELWRKREADLPSETPAGQCYSQFAGLTQVEALVKIARDSGRNRFALTEAKAIVIAAGLTTSRKNAYSILSTAVNRSERFRRVGPGEYEVVEKQTDCQPHLLTLPNTAG